MNEDTKKAHTIFGQIADFNNIQVLFLYLHSIKNGGI